MVEKTKVKAVGAGMLLALLALAFFALRRKAPPEAFACPHCSAEFASYEELEAHIEAVHPTEPVPPRVYSCTYCLAEFASEIELLAHIELVHPDVPPPPISKVELTDITIDKTSLVEGDAFTISITFSNPHDYDVWIKPEFGFGLLTGESLEFVEETDRRRRLVLKGFEAEAVLEGIGWDGRITVGGPKMTWLDLGIIAIKGSNMTNYIYDPDGAALTSGSYAYLKVPAKGQATTSKRWHIDGSARSKYWVEPMGYYVIPHRIVYPPIDLDVCVKVESAFYPEYHPEGIGIIRYGLPEAIGKTRHYKKVNYAPFAGAAPNVVNVRSEKTPI